MTGGQVAPGRDPDDYDRLRRRVLWAMPTGLYVIGSAAGEGAARRANLMTANLVLQVCVEPKLVAVAIEAHALSAELVGQSGSFTVSFVARADRALVRKFVKPAADVERDHDGVVRAINGEAVIETTSRTPVLASAPAWIECAQRQVLDLGSHRLFIGEVVDVSGPDAGIEMEVLRMEDTRMNYGG